jgi:hypothetical protein
MFMEASFLLRTPFICVGDIGADQRRLDRSPASRREFAIAAAVRDAFLYAANERWFVNDTVCKA